MAIKKLGLVLITALILFLIYDKFLSNKEILPKIQRLEQDLAYSEEALLEKQFNSKKLQALKKDFAIVASDFRFFQESPQSIVQNQLRRATDNKLKVSNYGTSAVLKELYKDSESEASLYYLDTPVSANNLSVSDLADIMVKLRKQKPRLIWENLNINSNNPERISLNGRLRAFFLSEELSLLMKGSQ